ncbi:hypothetical protein [Streptomyces sp. or3]|uniref:hypothetical protein n=1 Tax=Streptomyces sp. or3 TaxID=1828020 RepID=UPI000BFBFD41|nr:hypothetical protein [Streptomyces sp. or3]
MTDRMDTSEPGRALQAVMEASAYVRHGCSTMFGGSLPDCICPKAPCGGVAAGDEDYDCPEHGMYDRREYLHWASECPGPYAPAVTPPQ